MKSTQDLTSKILYFTFYALILVLMLGAMAYSFGEVVGSF